MKVITNNQARPVVYWYELTDKERQEFDYLETEQEQHDATFVRYRGEVYHLEDTQYVARELWPGGKSPFSEWDMFVSDSFFSGVLFRYDRPDYEYVICGRYYT